MSQLAFNMEHFDMNLTKKQKNKQTVFENDSRISSYFIQITCEFRTWFETDSLKRTNSFIRKSDITEHNVHSSMQQAQSKTLYFL